MANVINATSTGNGGLVSTGDDSGILNIQTNETTAITVDASQRVGIGTTSPSNILDIVSASNPTIRITDTTNNCYTELNATDTVGYVGTASNHAFAFTTNNTERMRIDSSGNVGIGASPSAKFDVNGQIRCSGTTAQAIYIYGAPSTAPYITINQYGVRSWDIGAGYYSSGTFSIQSGQTNGVYLGGTATSWASASDERLKDIIEPIDNALIKVNGLRSIIGKYKTDEEGVRRSFLIAQDIQTQFPEALESSDPDKLGVQYTDVIPLLVASIKELKALTDTQAETINALTARIVALEGQ